MSKRIPLVFNPEKKGVSEPATAYALQETKAPRTATKGKSRDGRQFIAAHVVPEAAKQFKLLAVQHGRTTQALLVEAINDLFTKYGLSRIADDE
jgi:hypothetical protein